MSSPINANLRQRAGKEKNKVNGKVDQVETEIAKAFDSAQANVSNEWDYKIAITIITVLAFATRFYGISHPDEVVFDEVHFGKVSMEQKMTGDRSDRTTVRIILPAATLLLRCSSSLRQTSVRICGLACGL